MVFLELWWEAWGSSQLVTGISGNLTCCLREGNLFSSCDGEHCIALVSQQGTRASSPNDRGILGYFLSCDGKLWVPLKVRRGPQATSLVASRKSGLLSCCEGHLRIPLNRFRRIVPRPELRRVTQGSSPVVTGILVILSSFRR